MLVALAACFVIAFGAPGGGAPPRPNVLLVTLDTVRADRIGAYGYSAAVTPTLDRLAREGVRFDDVSTHSPLTGPAHAGMFTGMYPARFGIRDNAATPLPAGTATLATSLAASGYRTGAFIGAFVLDRAYGFDHGFERFDSRFEGFHAGDKLKVERTTDEVVDAALAWLSELPADRPFFAWVHLYDAHAPYVPPPRFRTRFAGRPYDGEVAYVDSGVERLVRWLEGKGALDRTLIAAIGDHGEGLGDHGEEEHGVFLYDSVLRVPWVMRLPGRAHSGLVVTGQVRVIDLMPTLLNLVGVPLPASLDGESLVATLRGTARENVPVAYAETYYPQLHFGWSPLQSVRVPEWKYVHAPRPELYDLRRDRGELANAFERQQNVASRLGADLHTIVSRFGTAAASAPARIPDAETLARLRSLGYVGFTPTGSTTSGPDPKDMVPQLALFRRLLTDATNALKRRQPAEAVSKLKQALAINERAYDVHLALGDAYLGLRDYERAVGEYDAAALLNPGSVDPLLAAANVFIVQGRSDEARKRVDEAARLEPRSAEVSEARGRLEEKQGRLPAALQHYRAAVDGNPSDLRLHTRVINMALRLQQFDVAADHLQVLAAARFELPRTHYALGRVAEGRGETAKAAIEYRRALQLDPKLEDARTALTRLGQKPR